MATIKPFKGIRPPQDLVEQVASRPYDVLNSEEARAEAAGNEKSLYHIIKPEIDFPVGTDEHDEKVYTKAAENFRLFRDKGWLVQDDDTIIRKYTAQKPVYDFIAPGDGFGHTFWVIDDNDDIAVITKEFAAMPALYIADGHHRSAAAALVGAEKAKQNPGHRGDEEYNYFMAVCFPANQLTIIDYNRVVKDLNGLTPAEFLTALEKNFVVEEKGKEIYKPAALHNFALYLEGKWYSLTAKPGTYDDNDPIGVLDVTISSNLILDEILGIKDLRSDKRIDFVGGIRGLGELGRRVDSGEMKVALALYPVSMKQLMDIADTGNIMPPKTTWFEPKLRSGLVIHELE